MRSELTWALADELIASSTEEFVSSELVQEPLVTVLVITYNHAKYIAQALDSVLEQTTDFPFEIVVGEDCSSDGTGDIVRMYQRKHPSRIRVLRSTQRLGEYTGNGRLNLIRSFRAARGRYVCLLEGDDYWCDSSKIQSQASRLAADGSISLLCHRVRRINEVGCDSVSLGIGVQEEDLFPDCDDEFQIAWEMFFQRYLAQTCSIMFSRKYIPDFPEWMLNLPSADSPLCVFAATQGRVVCEPQVGAVYRRNPTSYWSSKGDAERAIAMQKTYLRAFRETARFQDHVNGSVFLRSLIFRVAIKGMSSTKILWLVLGSVRSVPVKHRLSFIRHAMSWYRESLEQAVPGLSRLPTLNSVSAMLVGAGDEKSNGI